MTRSLTRVLVLSMLASAATASAASPLDYLVYCAGDRSADLTKAVKEDVASECNVNLGKKDYCSLISGTPWDCATPQPTAAPQPPPPPDPTKPKFCAYNNIAIEITAGLKLPAGWTAKTGGKISFGVSVDKTPKGSCTPKPREPMPTEGDGGLYVTENGTLFAEVEFTVEGTLELTAPNGFGVTLKGTAKCGRGATIDYYKDAEVNLCPCKKTKKLMMNGAIAEVCTIVGTPTDDTPTDDPPEPDPMPIPAELQLHEGL